MIKDLPKLIFSIGICLGAGALGSFFTASSIPNWYVTLNKPFFSPPNWIFAPVWIALYILMGISLYMVISKKLEVKSKKTEEERKKAIQIFGVQLFLNAIWSIIFFGMQNPSLAFIDIVVLWVAITLTIKAFSKINKLASYLLYPYLAWVSFALVLNLAVVFLN